MKWKWKYLQKKKGENDGKFIEIIFHINREKLFEGYSKVDDAKMENSKKLGKASMCPHKQFM